MTESAHVARWISLLQDQPWDIHVFAFDDAGASARTYALLGWTATEPGSWWALHAFLFQREEGRRTFALLWRPFTKRFAISIYRAAARAASPTAARAVEPAGIVPGLPRQWRARYRRPLRRFLAAALSRWKRGTLDSGIVPADSERGG